MTAGQGCSGSHRRNPGAWLQFRASGQILDGRGNGTQMSGLTTHVLDTMHGQPASGLSLRLRRGDETLVEAVTNLDGRLV